MRHSFKPLTATALGLLLASQSTGAVASGFGLPELSIAGAGTANALVANSSELGALPYNPAGMVFHDGTSLVVGSTAIDLQNGVTTSNGEFHSHVDSPFYVPNLYATGHVRPDVSWGLAINAPFGLETNWPLGVFPILVAVDPDGPGPLPAGAAQPTRSKVDLVDINPNIAYRLGTDTSMAVGVDYYVVRDVRLNSAAITIQGDGSDYGYNLALLHRAGAWSFGAAFRSAVSVGVDGTVNSTAANTTLELPWVLQIGARYQASDKLALEFDIARTGWSKFGKIVVTAAGSGSVLVTSVNDWEDADAYRLGGTYALSADQQLRFGYAYDKTGQGDANFSTRTPDANRHLVSLGIAQKLGGWTLEASYMYAMFEDRTVATGGVYDGQYTGSAQIFGLGITTKL